MSIYNRAEREIDQLEEELEGATPAERRAILREIRDVEREVGEHEREMDRREEWDQEWS